MFYIFFLFCSISYSQITDDFGDGQLSFPFEWGGDTSSWKIVENSTAGLNTSDAMVLRLNAPADGSTAQHISFEPFFDLEGSVTWGAWIGRRSSSTYTGSNNLSFYIWSNSSDLESDTLDAYRLLIGDNSGDDELKLQRIDDGTATTILTGSSPLPNGLSDASILVRIFRTQTAEFKLYSSEIPSSGGGPSPETAPTQSNTPVFQGSFTDATYDISQGYVGFVSNHSTSLIARTAVEIDQVYLESATDQSLPVFISSFTALQSNSNVNLEWVTESEIDNIGFELYRSISGVGRILVGSYKTDSRLIGSGSTTTRSYYSYVDGPLDPLTSYTYTLFQIDRDGAVKNVSEISIFTSNSSPLETGAYPNPTKGRVSFQFEEQARSGNIAVYNLLGQAIGRDKYRYYIGNNRIDILLNNELPGGYYFADLQGIKIGRSFRFLYIP